MSTERTYNKMFKDYPDAIGIRDLQQMLGIGKNLAYQLINDNVIEHVRVGRKIVIPKIKVIEYLCSDHSK